MRYNMKHPLWRSYPARAKALFEAELRKKPCGHVSIIDIKIKCQCPKCKLIREILRE